MKWVKLNHGFFWFLHSMVQTKTLKADSSQLCKCLVPILWKQLFMFSHKTLQPFTQTSLNLKIWKKIPTWVIFDLAAELRLFLLLCSLSRNTKPTHFCSCQCLIKLTREIVLYITIWTRTTSWDTVGPMYIHLHFTWEGPKMFISWIAFDLIDGFCCTFPLFFCIWWDESILYHWNNYSKPQIIVSAKPIQEQLYVESFSLLLTSEKDKTKTY